MYDQLAPIRPYPGALGTPTAYFTGTVGRDLGRLAAVAGRPAEAEELLREALLRNRVPGARPVVALTCLDLAAVRRDRGERGGDRGALAEAAGLAGEALKIAEQLGRPGPAAAAVRQPGEIAALRDETDPLTQREARSRSSWYRRARTGRSPRTCSSPSARWRPTSARSSANSAVPTGQNWWRGGRPARSAVRGRLMWCRLGSLIRVRRAGATTAWSYCGPSIFTSSCRRTCGAACLRLASRRATTGRQALASGSHTARTRVTLWRLTDRGMSQHLRPHPSPIREGQRGRRPSRSPR